jgi:DNA-binding HxlR family transcriptional regulator
VTEPWEHIDDDQCHLFQASVELIGRRWSSAILLAMARGACRFSELRACVPGLSDRMLAQRLRELETAGLVRRQVTPTMPVQVSYRLTQSGSELMAALQPLVRWGLRWHGQQDRERSAGLPAPATDGLAVGASG